MKTFLTLSSLTSLVVAGFIVPQLTFAKTLGSEEFSTQTQTVSKTASIEQPVSEKVTSTAGKVTENTSVTTKKSREKEEASSATEVSKVNKREEINHSNSGVLENGGNTGTEEGAIYLGNLYDDTVVYPSITHPYQQPGTVRYTVTNSDPVVVYQGSSSRGRGSSKRTSTTNSTQEETIVQSNTYSSSGVDTVYASAYQNNNPYTAQSVQSSGIYKSVNDLTFEDDSDHFIGETQSFRRNNLSASAQNSGAILPIAVSLVLVGIIALIAFITRKTMQLKKEELAFQNQTTQTTMYV